MKDIVNFDYSYTADGTFDIKFKPVTRPLLGWKQEVYETAKQIRSLADRPLFLCMSGGIDSEVVARAFIENNIEFTALSLRHIKGTNNHDVDWAIKFCRDRNLKHIVIDFDFEDFVINKIPKYIEQGYVTWRTFRFQQLYLFELAESLGYTAVLGGGPSPFFTVDGEICLNFKIDEFMCLDWLKNNNQKHFPYFYWQNSEIMASYFSQGLINFMLTDPEYFVTVWPTTSPEKLTVYHKYWPEMPRRMKYDGFEKITGTDLALNYIVPRRQKLGEVVSRNVPVRLIKSQFGIN